MEKEYVYGKAEVISRITAKIDLKNKETHSIIIG